MKYLFTYAYSCLDEAYRPIASGNGSTIMTTDATRITEELIDDAKESVKKSFTDEGVFQVSIAPMGFFKFDEEKSKEPDVIDISDMDRVIIEAGEFGRYEIERVDPNDGWAPFLRFEAL